MTPLPVSLLSAAIFAEQDVQLKSEEAERTRFRPGAIEEREGRGGGILYVQKGVTTQGGISGSLRHKNIQYGLRTPCDNL